MAIPNITTDLDLKLAASSASTTPSTPKFSKIGSLSSPLTPLNRFNNLVNSTAPVSLNYEQLLVSESEIKTPSCSSLPLPLPPIPKPISKQELTQSGTGSRSSRKRRKGMEEFLDPEKNPEWLPPGWKVEVRVRDNGKSAGSKDTYYREPIKGRKFRSKREVLEFVENDGHVLRSHKRLKTKKEESPNPLPAKSSQARPYDYFSDEPPEKVRWVLGDSGDSWIPFIGDEMVPEHVRLQWAAMFNPLYGSKYQR
ncbi:hypothetical protein AQUCO_02700363v1 [Aquilegia coerulea]|uniref:MBD domain-containing protein n=1 Tax=Aquilegia coerulea TaxID=218851 RepID=A0A2G5D6I3_AQUCA|nr:hypothetical protein AQUCO_02700363v1 [Aquilegia coerulea]